MTRILTNGQELHIISNGKMPIEQLQEILIDIHPFITSIHLREKQKTAKELFQAVEMLSKAISLSKIIINDRVDVAHVSKVAGVQLAFHSLEAAIVKKTFPELRVGRSIHSYLEGKKALQDGTDYVLFGHVYPSQSKPGLTPKGIQELLRVTQLDIPIIAIGGITPENTQQVIQAGASGIAVMSGVLDSRDPLSRVKAYVNALKDGDGKSEKYF
ncbi:thiamine phosphate synthase [Neobacillus cucumis]|uniref:thiamine phosphate synthase n=1 Tax=Neobacillus cucumis TaxID=1740721 RepID=UPI001FDCC0D7|nr:thiamine phosphate synthase [Neobacillus cucumis]MBM7652302.1 thiazole tautomerase (transcriptional regulator TenI) [Neobacillus cucumis]